MSVSVETLIFCDGEGCTRDGPYADGDARHARAKEQRKGYAMDGWRFVGGKDYCPDCAARMTVRGATEGSVA